AVQGAFEARALAFGASSAVEEPADEDEPDAIKNVPGEKQEAAREHEHVTEHLPDAGRDARRLGQAFGPAPNDGPEHTAAIQRKARQDVKHRQQQVDDSQVEEQPLGFFGAAKGEAEETGDDRDEEARCWPCGSNRKFFAGSARLFGYGGDAAEDEQRDF